ncbi:MAG: hypothetical protein D8M59_03835 [Planctomycetes bacterium]|nr:hypothetical protein [Planctomycetota bacterium]NOG53126.1 hypothetical protein [Planctomycetota bacterium]
MMTEGQLQDLLRDLLEELMFSRDDADDPLAHLAERTAGIKQIRTYDDACLLTMDKGLVVECDDGAEYQLSIVKSR